MEIYTLSKKEIKIIKTQIFDEKQQNNAEEVNKDSGKVFISTHPTVPCCNMLKTLQRRRKCTGIILSGEHTPAVHSQ